MKTLQLIAAGLAALTLSGCGNLASVYRDDSLLIPGGHVVTMDAKQRAILSSRVRKKDNFGRVTQVYRRYCSEPSPDAFAALSMGTSGDLGMAGLKNADPEIKARAALALSETASSLERTQTVNVLRDAMFNTCQRYLNGSIDETELMIQAARDQRMIVSVLAIEQLTRTVRPQPIALISGGATAVYNDPDKVHDWYESASKAVTAAEIEDTQAQAEFTAANTAHTCVADEAEPDATTAPAKHTEWQNCKDATKKKEAAAATLTAAKGLQATYKTMMEKAAAGMSASSGTGGAAAGTVEQKADSRSLEAVAGHVTQIVEKTFAFDEFEMVCIARLRQIRPTLIFDTAKQTYTFTDAAGSRSFAASRTDLKSQAEAAVDSAQGLDAKCIDYIERIHDADASKAQLARYKADKEVLEMQGAALSAYLGTNIAAQWAALISNLGSDGSKLPAAPPADTKAAVALFSTLTGPLRDKIYRVIRYGTDL